MVDATVASFVFVDERRRCNVDAIDATAESILRFNGGWMDGLLMLLFCRRSTMATDAVCYHCANASFPS